LTISWSAVINALMVIYPSDVKSHNEIVESLAQKLRPSKLASELCPEIVLDAADTAAGVVSDVIGEAQKQTNSMIATLQRQYGSIVPNGFTPQSFVGDIAGVLEGGVNSIAGIVNPVLESHKVLLRQMQQIDRQFEENKNMVGGFFDSTKQIWPAIRNEIMEIISLGQESGAAILPSLHAQRYLSLSLRPRIEAEKKYV